MIIDDRYLIVGSANLNQRSLAGGRDSEIAVGLWPNITKQVECIKQIQDLRFALWSEHFGTVSGRETPEKSPCVKAVQKIGQDNWKLLNAGKHTDSGLTKKGHFCCWPIDGSVDGLGLRDDNDYIIDGVSGIIVGDDWYWWPTGYIGSFDLAE